MTMNPRELVSPIPWLNPSPSIERHGKLRRWFPEDNDMRKHPKDRDEVI